MFFDNVYGSVIRLFACVSLIIGAVECFAGYKIMKVMMAIWGFFIGSLIGVIIGVASDSVALGFIMVVLLGVGLAVVAFRLYIAGIFILTAFLSAIALYIISDSMLISGIIAILIGVLAVFFVKPVVIITTSFSGAGIILSSAYIMMAQRVGDNPIITAILWIPIALAGIACQFITTQNTRAERKKVTGQRANQDSAMTFSERKYPGMQRAYRNFCIKCGCELLGSTDKCPRCGFCIED